MPTYQSNGPSGEQELNGWYAFINDGDYTEAQQKALAEALLTYQAARFNRLLPEGRTWFPETSQVLTEVDEDAPEPEEPDFGALLREAAEATQRDFEGIEASVLEQVELDEAAAEAVRLLGPLHAAVKGHLSWFEILPDTFRRKSVSELKAGDVILVEADEDHGLRAVEWSDAKTLFLRSATTPESSPPTLARVTGKALVGMSAGDEGDPAKDETCISTVDGKVFVLTHSSVAVPE